MARTKEQTDKENILRAQMGETALPYEDEETLRLQAEAKIEEEKAEKERIRLEKEEKARQDSGSTEIGPIKISSKTPAPKKEEVPPVVINEDDDIEDEKLKKILAKRSGKPVESLDDFFAPKTQPAPEDKEKLAEERETRKVAFALQSGKISKKDIDLFVSDINNREQVVYDHIYAQQKEIDGALTDKEIEDYFDDRFGINRDKESREFKAGQKEIEFISDTIIKQKHEKYLSIDNEFSSFEKDQASSAKIMQEITAKEPQFKKDISEVSTELANMKVTLSDTESYDIELDPAIISTYTDRMLTPEYAKKIISKGYTKEEVRDTVRAAVIVDNFDSIVKGIVDAAMLKRQAGLRGIPPKRHLRHEHVVNEVQKESLQQLEEVLGVTAN